MLLLNNIIHDVYVKDKFRQYFVKMKHSSAGIGLELPFVCIPWKSNFRVQYCLYKYIMVPVIAMSP